jgi:TRAP-type uncharacterized transport system fused permease subunit
VALACFAAAPIARESGLKISFEAIKVAAAGFVIPFMAVYTPALMLQDGGPLTQAIGFWPAVAYIVFKTGLSIALWGVAVIGFLRGRLAVWERLLATAAAFTRARRGAAGSSAPPANAGKSAPLPERRYQ